MGQTKCYYGGIKQAHYTYRKKLVMELIVVLGIKPRKKVLKSIGYYRLKSKNYTVWDVSKCFENKKNNSEYPDEVKLEENVKKIDEINVLFENITKRNNSRTFYMVYGVPEKLDYKIKKKIKKKNGSLIMKTRFTNYWKINSKNECKKSSICEKLLISEKIKYYINAVRQTLNRGISYDYAFVPTLKRGYDEVLGDLSTEIVPIHVHDYDRSLEAKRVNVKNKATFISSDYPHHVEVKIQDKDNIDERMYYEELKYFFKEFKAKYNLDEVVISEHPNAFEHSVRNLWGEYSVVKGNTAKSVAKSRYVVSMGSNATLFAVMKKKPLLLLKTGEQMKNNLDGQCDTFSEMFDVRPTTVVGNQISWGSTTNTDCYDRVFYKYIKEKGTPEVNSFDYMYNYLNKKSS